MGPSRGDRGSYRLKTRKGEGQKKLIAWSRSRRVFSLLNPRVRLLKEAYAQYMLWSRIIPADRTGIGRKTSTLAEGVVRNQVVIAVTLQRWRMRCVHSSLQDAPWSLPKPE